MSIGQCQYSNEFTFEERIQENALKFKVMKPEQEDKKVY